MPITATFLILENSILKLILMQHILNPYRPWDLCTNLNLHIIQILHVNYN